MFMLPSVNDDLHALLKERRLSEALEVCLWAGGRAHLTLAHLFTRYQPTSARRCSNISKLTIKNRPTEWCASPEESNRRAELCRCLPQTYTMLIHGCAMMMPDVPPTSTATDAERVLTQSLLEKALEVSCCCARAKRTAASLFSFTLAWWVRDCVCMCTVVSRDESLALAAVDRHAQFADCSVRKGWPAGPRLRNL